MNIPKINIVLALFVIILFLNMPIVSALEISNIRAEEITDTSVSIKWDTDQPANSFLKYGQTAENMNRLGDANLVYSHQFQVENLNQQSNYLYSVESNSIVDNNNGGYYSFTTLAPDMDAPKLLVNLPESIKGNRIDITGKTEPGSEVKLYVNSHQVGTMTAIVSVPSPEPSSLSASLNSSPVLGSAIFGLAISPSGLEGEFTFSNVALQDDELNNIKIESSDRSGNMVNFTGVVFADATGPRLTLNQLPALTSDKKIKISGNVTESSAIEVFVNNRSVEKKEVIVEENSAGFEFELFLDDGENIITVTAKDAAGWESSQIIKLNADSLPPQISFELVSGTEYYEGRADTEITGKTKPGAKVYLYIFRQGVTQEKLEFSSAVEVIDADAQGEFTFEEVSFPPPPFTNWKQLAPREVPPGLQEVLISPLSQLEQEQRKTYKVYIIAEDSLGRAAFAERTVNINSCFTGNAFDITPMIEFQAPFKLDPGLMEDGRETIQAVFNLTYRGASVGFTNPTTGREEKSYEIIGNPQFRKACTQSMSDNDDYAVGCKLLPPTLRAVPNPDKTAFYVTADLQRADEFIDREENIWDDFQKRRLKMPLKIMINYRERNDNSLQSIEGAWSQAKTEVFCYDLSYFVDVPIESEELIPDFLVDTALPALNTTINAIETIKPYLRTIMIVSGVSCVSSFLSKMAIRFYRIFMQNFEPWKPADEEEKCPKDQTDLYLEDTITDWEKLKEHKDVKENSAKHGIPETTNKKLEDFCPNTAGAWEIEELFDQFFRWTCDRFFCSAAPAAWTAEADESQVRDVIQKQTQCAATASCATLEKVENCRELLAKNPEKAGLLVEKKEYLGECYRDASGVLYYGDGSKQETSLTDRGIWKMTPVDNIIKHGELPKTDLLTYKPDNSDDFCAAPDISCSRICTQAGNYKPVSDGYYINDEGIVSGARTTAGTSTSSVGTAVAAAGSAISTGLGARVPPNVITESDGSAWVRITEGPNTGKYMKTVGSVGEDYIIGTYNPTEASVEGETYVGKAKTAFERGGDEGYYTIERASSQQPSCYRENPISTAREITEGSDYQLESPGGLTVKDGKIRAGYTRDCFIGNDGYKYQCICELDESKIPKKPIGKREAVKKIGDLDEEWSYREATIYTESFGRAGTYYPEWRYYSGRDMSATFGLDYGLDNFKKEIKDKSTAEINPHTQTISTFQTVCLRGINARLEMLQSVLIGLRNCLVEAKYTGLHDAGMCKTIFTQYVCGMFYKFLTLFTSKCSPLSLPDMDFGIDADPSDGGISAAVDAGFSAIPQAMSSSISDLKGRYGNANLEQYFASGTQGFAESMCMWAMGYDFPLGMEFILDSAYSFEMASSVFFPIAERELSTFNPVKGTATFNYNLGGTILPGCNIRGYRTYLKCIGPEDLNRPNVECPPEGCDCMQATNFESPFQGEKTRVLDQGTSFTGIPRNQMFELPLPSPQKISSNFRYDHVIVELTAEQGTNIESCFDEGYRTGTGGIFYFPITEIQSPAGISCHVDVSSGRFICPELGAFFGGGTTYFEHPFMRCYDKKTEDFLPCNTPNLFMLKNEQGISDEIVIKPYLNLGGEGACLWVKAPNTPIDMPPITIPEGISGPYSPRISLGSVGPDMVSSSGGATIVTDTSSSNSGCGVRMNTFAPSALGGTFTFNFKKDGAGNYKIWWNPGVNLLPGQDSSFSAPPNEGGTTKLVKNSAEFISREDINGLQFTAQGFTFSNILGTADIETNKATNSCVYIVKPSTSAVQVTGTSNIQVTLELKRVPESGSCIQSTVPFPTGSLGRSSHTEAVVVQAEPLEVRYAARIHQDFIEGKYSNVIEKARAVVDRNEATLEDARAMYYYVSALVMQDTAAAGSSASSNSLSSIKSILALFFSRPYPDVLSVQDNFVKIKMYMCQIDSVYGSVNQGKCN